MNEQEVDAQASAPGTPDTAQGDAEGHAPGPSGDPTEPAQAAGSAEETPTIPRDLTEGPHVGDAAGNVATEDGSAADLSTAVRDAHPDDDESLEKLTAAVQAEAEGATTEEKKQQLAERIENELSGHDHADDDRVKVAVAKGLAGYVRPESGYKYEVGGE
jgi:hypothetical protein